MLSDTVMPRNCSEYQHILIFIETRIIDLHLCRR